MNAPIGERPQMPEYGVGGDGWQALPWSWAAERLSRSRNYWVATVTPQGQPHSLPVWGVWHDDEHRFMFSCAHTSTKASNLAANPRLTLTNDDSVECVSMHGLATLVTDGARLDEWVDRYVAKYGAEGGDDLGTFLRGTAVFDVAPTVAFAIIERPDEFATRATRWRFT